jgi:hypothetical protein
MIQFGFLTAVLGLMEIARHHYSLGLFVLGGGLMMLSSRNVPLNTKVTWRSLFTPVDDSMNTNLWEKTARLLATLAIAGGAAVGLSEFLTR